MRPLSALRLPVPARALAAAAVVILAGACSGDEPAAGDDTSGVTSDLLGSLGARMQSSPPEGGAPAPGGDGSILSRPADLDALGFDSGDPDAPVRVVEFSDFGCGYCREFHTQTWPTLEEEFVETGKVVWKYVPMILGMFGPNAEVAALAGECAMEQERFPALRDRLFEDQAAWKRADDPLPPIRGLVEDEGLDVDRWELCMESGARMERVQEGTALSRQLGVRGTPTFFILGYGSVPGALPAETFREILEAVHRAETGGGDASDG